MKITKDEYLSKLDKNDLMAIIKYGLIESNAPKDVNVEDIYYLIGCNFINEQ